ncbi:MAG: sigma-54-dependent Fis family transcriptional regulator [Deltaproteobacteria bacterium]|nr:MAG: sigma-54-dependent Fis family transcriptional regulator [Deltaproteobacteria bacterium]
MVGEERRIVSPVVRHPELQLTRFHDLVTVAPEMRELFTLIRRAGRSDSTVLIRGESGTGKELVANALHLESTRASKPLQAVNCATFTSELLASELFGHVRGAFTGAIRDRKGLLTLADKGTLFLDEVAELPIDLQARLLRVLQLRRFTPVGDIHEQEVDVRLISATNAGLRELVAEGRFREDLMYRLRVVVLYLPRLAERTGDVEALTWHFIDQFNQQGNRFIDSIDRDAWAAMRSYPWPGNVRELRNNLEQAFVLGEGPTLKLGELAPELRGEGPERVAAGPTTLVDLERDQLMEAYRETGGHRGEMAERLGISRPTLYRRLKKHGLL